MLRMICLAQAHRKPPISSLVRLAKFLSSLREARQASIRDHSIHSDLLFPGVDIANNVPALHGAVTLLADIVLRSIM